MVAEGTPRVDKRTSRVRWARPRKSEHVRGALLAAALLLWTGRGAAEEPGPARLIRGPYLQGLLDTSVEVRWFTDVPSPGAVLYSAEDEEPQEVAGALPVTSHRIRLEGLRPGTRYSYQIRDGREPLASDLSFRTAPDDPNASVRVVVTGDSGSGREPQYKMASVIRELSPDLFLIAGDLVYTGSADISIFDPYKEILPRCGFYPVPGNHDLFIPWKDLFTPPCENPQGTGTYYSFNWGNAHFVGLDSNWSIAADSPQTLWLVSDLEAARLAGVQWTILYFHSPPYTVGMYSWSHLQSRFVIPPLADRFQVDLVIAAHDHNYQRTYPLRGDLVRDGWQDPRFVFPRGTVYLVTGGGGGTLYPVGYGEDLPLMRTYERAFHIVEVEIAGATLSVQAIDANMSVIDSFTIVKEGARPELRFLRGDTDLDGELGLSDVIRTLSHLFLGGSLVCPAAAEMIGGGSTVTIADPVYLLNFLFLGGPAPAPPFPGCGSDPQADDAGCVQSGC